MTVRNFTFTYHGPIIDPAPAGSAHDAKYRRPEMKSEGAPRSHASQILFLSRPLLPVCVELAGHLWHDQVTRPSTCSGMGSSVSFLFVLLVITVVTHLFSSLRRLSSLPRSLDWAGQRPESFAKARACIRQLVTGLKSLDAGYFQVRSECHKHPFEN